MTEELSNFINQVKLGRHAMITKPDYVVLSRNIYDALLERLEKLEKKGLIEHIDDGIDLEKEHDEILNEIEEQNRREYLSDVKEHREKFE